MRPLLECWESYGLPGDAYVLGYFGIEQVPQIFAIDCEGAPKALKQRDGKLRCPPCEAVRKARGQGIIQLMKKKYESTLHVESIVSKPFVTDFDISKLNGFVQIPIQS
jgi:hypothetical protein